MKIAGSAALAALLALAAPACAVTVEVVITGPGRASYAVSVGGITKNGKLAAKGGRVTSREAIDVTPQSAFLPARLTFFGEDGPLAICPAVKVTVNESDAACTPSFTLVEPRAGERASCRSACDRPKSSDDDDEESVIASAE